MSRCDGRLHAVDALEHVVLQHEMPRVGPIVRDLGRGVIPERVGHGARRGGGGAHRVHGRVVTRPHPAGPGRPREPVHGPAVDVTLGRDLVVRTAPVDQRRVVVRAHASADAGNGHAHGRHAATHRDPVGAGEGAEVIVERPVLLHHDDHVADLVDAIGAVHGGADEPCSSPAGSTGRSCRCSSTRPRSPRAPTRARSACAARSSCRRCGAHRAARFDNATTTPRSVACRGATRAAGQVLLTRSVYRPCEYQLFTWK